MENWNKFLDEDIKDVAQMAVSAGAYERPPEAMNQFMQAMKDVMPELSDEELGALAKSLLDMGILDVAAQARDIQNEGAKEAGLITGSFLGTVGYVTATIMNFIKDNPGMPTDELAALISNSTNFPEMFAGAALLQMILMAKGALKNAMKSQYEKDSEKMNKRPMQEEMEEMSDVEEKILDVLQDLSAPDIVVALENWVKGGKHTMEDLLMHLGKMMSENIDEEKLTKAMKKEKEKVVKGMKKNKKDFKKRYGKDAEDVMYATATKIAKEKK